MCEIQYGFSNKYCLGRRHRCIGKNADQLIYLIGIFKSGIIDFFLFLLKKKCKSCPKKINTILSQLHLENFDLRNWKFFFAEMLLFTKCVLVSLQEYNNFLLKSYFNLWWSNAIQQRRYEKDIIERAEENRKTQRIDSSFCFWRHHLRATLVAR